MLREIYLIDNNTSIIIVHYANLIKPKFYYELDKNFKEVIDITSNNNNEKIKVKNN